MKEENFGVVSAGCLFIIVAILLQSLYVLLFMFASFAITILLGFIFRK